MNDDLLNQFTRALADEHDGATVAPEATRARVIRNLAEQSPRGRKWFVMGIPLLAVLGGSTAWAAASGQLAPLVERATAALGIDRAEETEQRADDELGARTTAAAPRGENESAQEGLEPDVEEEKPDLGEPDLEENAAAEGDRNAGTASKSRTGTEHGVPSARHAVAPRPAGSSEENAEHAGGERARRGAQLAAEEEAHAAAALAAYEAAHDAHFSEGNCTKAIVGYASYLQTYPDGGFAIEARYNRGMCLAQVGRTSAARAALQPFADGEFGNYRRARAAELIDALGE